MQLGRTILILLLALSVALLPTKGGAAVSAKSADMSDMSVSMDYVSSSMDDMDCCPHKKPPSSEKAIDGCCSSMATCPMNYFGIAGTSSLIIFPSLRVTCPSLSRVIHCTRKQAAPLPTTPRLTS